MQLHFLGLSRVLRARRPRVELLLSSELLLGLRRPVYRPHCEDARWLVADGVPCIAALVVLADEGF